MGRNTVGKGEIARYEQFLPFPQCFQRTCNAYKVKTSACLGKVKGKFSPFQIQIYRTVKVVGHGKAKPVYLSR